MIRTDGRKKVADSAQKVSQAGLRKRNTFDISRIRPMSTMPLSWKRSLLIAAIACYAPFLVCTIAIDVHDLPSIDFSASGRSAIGTDDLLLKHVLCAVGPSLLPFWLISRVADVGSGFLILMAIPMTVAIILGVASLGRLGRDWLVGSAVAAFILNGMAAFRFFLETI